MVDRLHNFWPRLLMIVIPMLFSRATTQQEQVASKDAQFYNNRGIAYAAKGQYDRAVSDFTMALEINPRDALAYYNRARAYYFKKQYYKSWRDISKAQDLGYKVPRKFLNDLRKASGRKK